MRLFAGDGAEGTPRRRLWLLISEVATCHFQWVVGGVSGRGAGEPGFTDAHPELQSC